MNGKPPNEKLSSHLIIDRQLAMLVSAKKMAMFSMREASPKCRSPRGVYQRHLVLLLVMAFEATEKFVSTEQKLFQLARQN